MRRRTLFILLAVIFLGTGRTIPVSAQAQVTEIPVEYTYGKSITFRALLQSDKPVQDVFIFFQAQGDPHTMVQLASATQRDDGAYELSYTVDLTGQPLRTFSSVIYHFKVNLAGGGTYTSSEFKFSYIDNRFEWQTLEEKPFRVHWYEGDLAFGQNILDVARASLERIQSLLPMQMPEEADIYVYPNNATMQDTLTTGQQSWVAGHADPELGVIVVALPDTPEQRLLINQRIPHELMHVLLFKQLGASYNNLPTWFNEGLATAAELYPNPDYQVLLNNAHKKNGLLPFTSLCQAFPRDLANASLAYAQAASFTRFLYGEFGTSGLQTLIQDYKNGLDCKRGVESAFGMSLLQLERRWRQDTFSENAYQVALDNLLPWVVLLAAVLAAPVGVTLSSLRRRPK